MNTLSVALGATLFHFLWQGLAIALLLAPALAVTRSSRARYAMACAAMFAMPVVFCVTLALSIPAAGSRAVAISVIHSPGWVATGQGSVNALPEPLLKRLQDAMRWFVPFWLTGLAVFYIRSLAGWMGVRHLRRHGVQPAPASWQSRLAELAARLRIARSVALLESALVDVPVVAGLLRPVILLPLGLLTSMPVERLEYLLIHELAHVRRFDYLVNLLQKAVEGLLFYHPAVWWISGVLSAERENCCDDMVLAARGDAHGYAATLAALERNRGASLPALAATDGSLTKRIRRILGKPRSPRAVEAPLVSTALLLASCLIAFLALQAPTPLAAQQAESSYDKWLKEDVVYIIEDRERAAFLQLNTDDERDRFIEQFWLRRDPTPATIENEFKAEHYRRISFTNAHFGSSVPGWKTDRGRIYITFGPPDEIDSHPSCGADRPHEMWMYRYLEGIGENVKIRFVDPDCNGEYRMILDNADTPNGEPLRFRRK